MNSCSFDFDTPAGGSHIGSLKGASMPQAVRDAGLSLYWGAEFGFKTCPAFSEGVRRCAEGGRYGFTIQSDEYNARVQWWMKNVRGFDCDPAWIVPTHGTIFGLATAIRMFLLADHRRLLVIHPGYNRFAQAAHRMGLASDASDMKPVNGRYEVDWDDLERRMADPQNGLLAFSNPNNPTGVILDRQDLERISALSQQYGMPVFCDEIFAEVTRGSAKVYPYILCKPGRKLAITSTTLGKSMSLTGVNHANLLIPDPDLRERYIRQKYADHYGSIDPMLHAGLMNAYTEEGAAFIRALNDYVDGNVQLVEEEVPRLIPGAKVFHPEGTFVIWIDYSGCGMTEDEVARLLNEEYLFCGDAGDDYGASRYYYRYSIAVPRKELIKSFDYIRKVKGE
ncbi:MAG: aminotransferase class I/II-fold pyridoxal phosphate-dependent enzyme [Aristaeellaceae bacterium]